jgi:aspartate aminotransferase
MNERVNELWAEGRQVYHLGFGESRFPVHPRIAEALAENAHRKSYLPAQGVAALREQVAAFYETHFHIQATPEQVMIGPGSKALIYALLLILEGDLILPRPAWVSYQTQARLVGKRVEWIATRPEEQHRFSITTLHETRERSRAAWGNPQILLLNSPNNPTGQMLHCGQLEEIARYAREHELILLSDEIYGLTSYEQNTHVSIAREYPEGTVVLGGLSKHLSLGGWRLGVALVPQGEAGKRLIRALRTIATETWSSVTAPVQYAAIIAYSGDPEIEAYIEECTTLHAIRTRYLWRHLDEMGITCAPPEGGFYLFPNFDRWRHPLAARGIHTSDDLAAYLLDRYQLATLPGSAFGAPPEELSLRLSSSYLDMETDEKAAQILDAYRSDPNPERLMQAYHPAMNEAIGRFRRFVEALQDEARTLE